MVQRIADWSSHSKAARINVADVIDECLSVDRIHRQARYRELKQELGGPGQDVRRDKRQCLGCDRQTRCDDQEGDEAKRHKSDAAAVCDGWHGENHDGNC